MIRFIHYQPDKPDRAPVAQAEELTIIISKRGGAVLAWTWPGASGEMMLNPGDRLKVSGWGE